MSFFNHLFALFEHGVILFLAFFLVFDRWNLFWFIDKFEFFLPQPKKQRMADVGDNLDKLINKYRQRFSKDINDAKRPGHKSKWFE